MGVKIEILDYQYSTGDNIIDLNEAATATGWTVNNSFSGSFAGTGGTGTVYLTPVSTEELKIGQEYRLKFRVQNHNGAGEIGFSTQDASGVTLGIGGSARLTNNGNIDITFTCTATGFPRIFAQNTITAATIDRLQIYQMSVIDWDNSIVGELDVTDHDDFPLALTFQISDIKDLTSTSGDYSKTFKVPATKNNNNLLKHLYKPNIIVTNDVTSPKKCRILINNLYSLDGIIRVNSVGGVSETPTHYDCVFFGNNLGWAGDIGESELAKLYQKDGYGDDIEYNRTEIVDSWTQTDSETNTDLLVYPVVSYGDFNPSGFQRSIQLLQTYDDFAGTSAGLTGYYGNDNLGASYGTPAPESDWRPALWVKKTFEKIFKAQGYQVVSEFFNTSIFKQLVWLLPNVNYYNTEERLGQYSFKVQIISSGTVPTVNIETADLTAGYQNAAAVYDNSNIGHGIDLGVLNTNIQYTNSYINNEWTYTQAGGSLITKTPESGDSAAIWSSGGGSTFTAPEFGYYNLKALGITSTLSDLKLDGATPPSPSGLIFLIPTIFINIQVKTVGQTSYNTSASISIAPPAGGTDIIGGGFSAAAPGLFISANNIGVGSSYTMELGDIPTTVRYLNKGDKVRLSIMYRCRPRVQSSASLSAGDGVWSFSSKVSADEFSCKIDPARLTYGQTYNIKDIIDPDIKQIDFIKGISHAFNLKMTTDESTRVVKIEPFESFYLPYGQAIDWTYKLDRDQKIRDKWLSSKLKRDLVFKYDEDSNDEKVKSRSETYFDDLEDEYPYQETLPDTFEKGQSTFKNPFFSGTYNSKDQDSGYFISPTNYLDTASSACLWTEDESSSSVVRPDKGNDFNPRLLFYNKYTPTVTGTNFVATSNLIQKRHTIQNWSTAATYLVAYSNNTVGFNFIPQATSYNQQKVSSPNLAYGNVRVRNYNDDYIHEGIAAYSGEVTVKGLYDTYYKQMFEMMKSSPRIRTVHINFTISEVINLDFRKLIYIDGCYYRINRVVDYAPNLNKSTKVELIEWLQLGTFAVVAPALGDTSNWGGSLDGGAEDDSNDNMGL